MSQSDDSMPAVLGDYPAYALYDLVTPAGKWPVSAEFEAAASIDRRARQAYASGAYVQAADAFLEMARLLRVPPDDPYVVTLKTNRAHAYRNAASAWAMADDLETARRKLLESAAADPQCTGLLADLVNNLPAPASR